MSTVIVAWADENRPAKPIGIVSEPDVSTSELVDRAKTWCQVQHNRLAQDVMPFLEWKYYLSRGTGPGTAHYVANVEDMTFEIWIVGELK